MQVTGGFASVATGGVGYQRVLGSRGGSSVDTGFSVREVSMAILFNRLAHLIPRVVFGYDFGRFAA